MKRENRVHAVTVLVCLLLTLVVNRAAWADDSPNGVVTTYMTALQTRDFATVFHCLGADVRADDAASIREALDQQEMVILRVRAFRIVKTRQEGGLADVTVEEQRFFDVSGELRDLLQAKMPLVAGAVRWGDSTVTERFVLVRLDGRWQFAVDPVAGLGARVRAMLAQVKPFAGVPMETILSTSIVNIVNGQGVGALLAECSPIVPAVMDALHVWRTQQLAQIADMTEGMRQRLADRKADRDRLRADVQGLDALMAHNRQMRKALETLVDQAAGLVLTVHRVQRRSGR